MPYCSRCGVEVNDQAEKCPLCNSPIQQLYKDPAPGREYPEDQLSSAAPRLSVKEKRNIAVFMMTCSILIPVLITITVDITANKGMTWSVLPIIALVSGWLMVILPLMNPRRYYVIIWGEVLMTWGTLSALHRFGRLPVEIPTLGVPITFSGAVIAHIIVSLSRRTSRKGGNIAAFILIGAGIFCGLTDIILSWKLHNIFHVSWSLVVQAAILPVSAMLLYLHYRKKKVFSRYFHT